MIACTAQDVATNHIDRLPECSLSVSDTDTMDRVIKAVTDVPEEKRLELRVVCHDGSTDVHRLPYASRAIITDTASFSLIVTEPSTGSFWFIDAEA